MVSVELDPHTQRFISGLICEVVCAAKSVGYALFRHHTVRLPDLIKLGRIPGTSHWPTGLYGLLPIRRDQQSTQFMIID